MSGSRISVGSAFTAYALREFPKLLMLQDRNPHSPTYGCFDRNYWQYRRTDFPTGMAQEFVYPLALAYSGDFPGNSYCGDAALAEWIEAGIRFAAANAHCDGSCDDFFPYERASGATAFSLLGCMEAYRILGLDDRDLEAFFARRGRWLAAHRESGRLSNHEALIVYCLYVLWARFGLEELEEDYRTRLSRLLSWQHDEGWFQEYEGCDLGYQTLTIGLLTQLHQDCGDETLRAPIERAIGMTAQFMHPDGSFGGEYSSRNTYNYFPHGFEIAGKWLPEALDLNDRFAAALETGDAPCYSDDHMVAHHLWSYLLAAKHCVADKADTKFDRLGRAYYPSAGLLVERRDDRELYVALNKGGTFKYFRGGKLVFSDTQISLKRSDGRTAVCHLIDDYDTELGEDTLTISGNAGFAKQAILRPFANIVLRAFMLIAGRFFPGLVRRVLQRMLITKKRPAPYEFSRHLDWGDGGLTVCDEIRPPDWHAVETAGISGHQTSISVVQSRPYHPSQHQPWLDLTEKVRGLAPGETLRVERRY